MAVGSALVPGLLIGAATTGVAWVLLSRAEERAVARASLDVLHEYEGASTDGLGRSQALNRNVVARVLGPLAATLANLGRRFTPVGYLDAARRKFVFAGRSNADTVERFIAIRVATVLAAGAVFLGVFFFGLGPGDGLGRLLLGGVLCLGLILAPDAWLNREADTRRQLITRALPDVLDLLTISVEAGLGFEQGIDRVIRAVPGPLSDEFARMLGEVRAGATRADAMRAMEERVGVDELRSFVLAIIQADTFGVSIGRVLRSQADEMRVKRRQLAQERAQKAPVKMLFPMMFLIFPSLFIVVLGPAALNIVANFGS